MGKMEKVVLSQEDLRRLQLNELQLLVAVYGVCQKNNIKFSLDGGTLLGAARDHGFIPWDDDADVIFTREEYEKFYEACKSDLDSKRFFLQDYRTDPEYRWGYAKLRLNNTEFIRLGQENMKYRTGVCIDIFVLDKVADNWLMRRLNYFMIFCIRKMLYSELGKEAAPNMLLRGWYRFINLVPKNFLFSWRNWIARCSSRKSSQLLSHYLWPYPRRCMFGIPARCFDNYSTLKFEGMDFPVIAEYDDYLRIVYGDYMTPPPSEKRCGPGEASTVELLDISLKKIQEEFQTLRG